MSVTTRFTNIAEIKRANADAGKYWFSADTIRFFDGRVESRVYDDGKGGRLWVDSIQDHGRDYVVPREFKIAKFDTLSHDIDRPVYQSFRDKDTAEQYLIDNLL